MKPVKPLAREMRRASGAIVLTYCPVCGGPLVKLERTIWVLKRGVKRGVQTPLARTCYECVFCGIRALAHRLPAARRAERDRSQDDAGVRQKSRVGRTRS